MRPIIDELLKGKPRSAGIHILREFLQVHILYNISKSKYAKHLVFMGGTALRILYNTSDIQRIWILISGG
jgi:predicted nucleotidyltransferase component of viral defense system